MTKEQIKKIAITYGRTSSPVELAKEFGVTKQRIQQIAVFLRKHGLNIPAYRISKMKDIIEELKVENPELFVPSNPLSERK